MRVHRMVTLNRVMAATEESMFGMTDQGFCIACGEEAYGVEPDAREYPCESCGASAVYGAAECLLSGFYVD